MDARPWINEPIKIVGAGPAGLACAIALARAGRKVVVQERHDRVGARFHGDFQGIENWSTEGDVLDEMQSAGIFPTFERYAVREGAIFDPRGRRFGISSREPLYYVVRRGSAHGTLDSALAEQARLAGVEIQFGQRVSSVDGPAVLAGGPRRADAIASGYAFDTGMPDGDFLALGQHLAPFGYSYLLVHNGRGTVASCMFSGFKRHGEYVERTIDFFTKHAGLQMQNSKPFGGFANFRLPRTGTQGAHPVIGEQAGFQDALAGFGIRYAVRSGLLAARSIIDRISYEYLWRHELLPQLRTGVVNRFLYNILGDSGREIAARWLGGRHTRDRLRGSYRSSLAKTIIYPLARLIYQTPLSDVSCNHLDCHCVWCECQKAEMAAAHS